MKRLTFVIPEECDKRNIKVVVETSNVKIHPCMLPISRHFDKDTFGDSNQQQKKHCDQRIPLSGDVAVLDIFYSGNRIEHSLQVLRMDMNMLLNSVGGALGLFLGLSFNSVFVALFHHILFGFKWMKKSTLSKRSKQ